MKTTLDCIPCFLRQALDAARYNSEDPEFHKTVLRQTLAWVAEMDLEQSPPVMGQRIHRQLKQISGIEDPYREIKERMNNIALSLLPALRKEIESASDPLFAALRLSIAGNVIDLGAYSNLESSDVIQAIQQTSSQPISGDFAAFKEAVQAANSILYLADNAGEIAFDRLLIEQLLPKNITLAVRGAPVLNDCTHVDAVSVGLDKLVNIIDNGSDAPGTILSDCSREFLSCYENADLVIAKGQGNFESLNNEKKDIRFLFKVKCPVIASETRQPVNTLMLSQSTN